MKTNLLVPFTFTLGLLFTGCAKTAATKDAAMTEPTSTGPSTTAVAANPTSAASNANASAAAAADTSPPPTVSVTIPPPAAPADTTPAAAENSSAAAEAAPAAADGTPSAVTDTPLRETAAAEQPGNIEALARAERIHEWNLRPADISAELATSDRIERTKEPGAGAPTGPMDSGEITNAIAGKLQADLEMASLKLNVLVVGDLATLTGTAHSAGQIGRAMALALDTEGVSKVVSRIKLDATP